MNRGALFHIKVCAGINTVIVGRGKKEAKGRIFFVILPVVKIKCSESLN